MDLDIFRSKILNGIFDNDESFRKTAEENFYALLDENPCITLQLLIENSNTDQSSSLVSITLLGSVAHLISDKLCEIGDEQFHQDFQSSLLLLLQNSSLSPKSLSNVSFIISRYSKIYYPNWPSLLENLFQIIQSSNHPSFAIDCISYCISNGSIVFDDQILQTLIQLIQSILDSIPDLIPQFLSAMKLLFTLYQCDSIDETFKSNLKIFSEKIVGVNIDSSDQDLHDRYMIELSNFADENIDFFEPSLGSLVDLLGAKICSQQFSENVENSSVLVLKYIFCNKKYTNEFQSKSIEVYDLLVRLISTKLPEAEIDPDEGENALNEINIIANAKDAIKSIAHNYGGFDDVSIYLITSFSEEQTEDFGLFVSNFISFGCIINEVIDFIDPPTFLSDIIPIYKLGFSNQSIDCRYRSIVSLRKVIKALGNYRIDFDWDSQEVITLIFETLSEEPCQVNITALLLALKTSLATFKDYHDNIENIIQPLDQNFDSFSLNQQSIIISCYSCCCLVCEDENEPYTELMLGILNRIVSVLKDGYQSELGDFYFSCLDAVLDFDKFVSSSELFNELSPIILEFISSFDSNPNQDESTPTMMDFLESNQIDIMNRALRSLISICPESEISDFSAQVFQPIFMLALADIEPEKHYFEENKSDLQTNYEIIKNYEENSWICYSKNSIRNISESLRTIYLILDQSPEIIDHLLQQTIEIIGKWINGCFSFSLVIKCTQILCLLFGNQKMKQQDTEPFILNIFVKLIDAFDLIDDLNDENDEIGKKTISFINLFNKVFEFIGQFFNSPDSLSVVVGGEEGNNPNPIDLIFKLYSKWYELHQMSLSSSNEDKNNLEIQKEYLRVEKKIGSMFDPIFKYYSYPEMYEKLNPLMMQSFPIDETNQFFTPTFFVFWSSMAINSSLCNDEQIVKIGSFFGEILIKGFDCFPPYVTENAAESIIKIVNSGRLSIEFFIHLIGILEEAVGMYKEKNDRTLIDNLLIPHLLILIENVNKNGVNLSLEEEGKIELLGRLIVLLLACLPVSFLVKDNYINKSARCFLSILSLNHPLMSDASNLAKICSLALLYIIVYKPPVLEQLVMFVKSVFFDEQGQLVYNELIELPLSQRFGNECVEFIKEMADSQE